MNAKNLLHIAFSFDQNFITPTYVFLTSIFSNNEGENIYFHSIATGVSSKDKEDIATYIRKHNADISYYEIDDKNLNKFVVPEHSYFTVATYYRLFFPSLVPETVKQLLYIDTDTVVINSLKELYQTNTAPYPAAAALDAAVSIRPDLGIYEAGHYFNAGVLLIDMDIWKAQRISEKAIQFLIDFPEKIQWVDQDALNAVLHNNIYLLSNNYNITFYDIPKELPKRDYKRFLSDKFILHFTTGLHKPWSFLGENKFRYVYHHYLKKSPRSLEKKYKAPVLNFKTISFFLRLRLLEHLYNYPVLLKWVKGYSKNP